MQTLFDELPEFKDLKTQTPKTELKIQKGNVSLSKIQQDFNKIIARIANLEKSIVEEDEKITNLLYHYNETVYKEKNNLADEKFKMICVLHESKKTSKYSKKINTKIKEIILSLFDEIFSFKEATEEQIKIFDLYSDSSYKEEIDEQGSKMKEDFEQMIQEMYGIDIDTEGIDFDDPNSIADFQAKLQEQIDAHSENQQNKENKKKQKKKTQKQIENEELIRAEEEIKTKNIRSIYISLTKILHPDLETETVLKQEKEELMKVVTQAYENKDLATLLKLEIEWVQKTSNNMNKISDDKLKIYISVLSNRVKELESEKHHLYHHQRCEPIHRIIRKREIDGKKELDINKNELKKIKKSFSHNINTFLAFSGVRERTEFINDFFNSEKN